MISQSAMPAAAASIDPADIARFSGQAAQWWDVEGPFKPLHRLNPVRIGYIRDQICAHYGRIANKRDALKGLMVLDAGCGGGLLAEPLVRLGAKVTGVDASEPAIEVARVHAAEAGLKVTYRAGSVEELAAAGKSFDVVTALEIIEHVADRGSFFTALARLVRPGGLLVMSTLNRNPKSFLMGIVAAEYVLRWVPRGTHQWGQFVKPSELVALVEDCGFTARDLTGLVFNPLRGGFELRKGDLDVNYLMAAVRG